MILCDLFMEKKIILITGASSGLGKKTSDYLANKGHVVIGTSRNAQLPDTLPFLNQSKEPTMVQMDITNDQSIEKVIDFIQNKFQRIDVLINNAGKGISGPVEESDIRKAQNLFATNFFGMLNLTQQILPMMRAQKQGLIINISSIGGIIGLPYQGMYSATKFATEGLTEALRIEVKPFGIKVVLVEPGDFNTNFSKNREKIIHPNSVYLKSANKTIQIFEHDENHGSDPIKFAYLIERIIRTKHPAVRYRTGAFSQKFAAKLKGVLSDKIIQWLLMRYYKIK